MEGKLIVPKRWDKGRRTFEIRALLDRKFRYDERVQSVIILNETKCIVTTQKPLLHDNPYHRIEFETQANQLEYEIVPRKCYEVMEG